MNFGIIELPQEGVFKVRLDEDPIPGYVKKSMENDRWEVHWVERDGDTQESTRLANLQPRSREAAAALLLYYHFEQERIHLTRRRKEDTDGDS